MLERDVEQRLYNGIRALGGLAYKFTSPGRRSVPDRICILPGGRVWFVECKRPGAVPTEQQAREMRRLRLLGCQVAVVDSYMSVDRLLGEMEC